METSTPQQITVYGTRWCPDSTRAKSFLDQKKVAYTWIDIDKDPEARKFVEKVNNGFRSVPTIVFPDGSILVEPSTSELAKKLGV
ncbi:MAG: NrdH-redoxin [Anaerolineae bacterium]|nr:NrdH-redoxin [Anaerolineae bacterium]